MVVTGCGVGCVGVEVCVCVLGGVGGWVSEFWTSDTVCMLILIVSMSTVCVTQFCQKVNGVSFAKMFFSWSLSFMKWHWWLFPAEADILSWYHVHQEARWGKLEGKKRCSTNSGIATGGQGGHRGRAEWKICQKWEKKREKIRKKREKIEKKRKNQEGSFTLPLLTDKAGYTTKYKPW